MKKLDITPYNDVLYNDCMMNSIFPMLSFYGVDIYQDIIFLDYPRFFVNPEKGILGNIVEMQSILSINHLLQKNNLSITAKDIRPDRLSIFIKNMINANQPVLISVDCFYFEFRKDAFQKNHMAHTVLIYGYNDKKNTFTILEHEYESSLTFIERDIPTKMLLESYKSYYDNCKKNALFIVEQKKSNQELLTIYGEESKEQFMFILKNAIEGLDEQKSKATLKILSKLMVITKVKRYIATIKNECREQLQRQIRNLSIVLSLVAKCDYSNTYDDHTIEICKSLFNEFLGCEGIAI